MKSILFALAILFSTTFGTPAVADHRELVNKARDVSRLIFDKEDEISPEQAKDVDGYLDKIIDTVNNGSKKDLVCLESSQQAGKYCLKSLTGDNTCLGNYFSNAETCRASLRTSKRGFACYESKDNPGKGLVAKVEESITRIGNYYTAYASCPEAMAGIRDNFVCMESERNAGKFFIANLEKDAEMVGPYFGSLGECKTSLSDRP